MKLIFAAVLIIHYGYVHSDLPPNHNSMRVL